VSIVNLAIHAAIELIAIALVIGQSGLNFACLADATTEISLGGGGQPLSLTVLVVAASFGVAALIQFVVFLLTRKRKIRQSKP
jgi:hypothetical protein